MLLVSTPQRFDWNRTAGGYRRFLAGFNPATVRLEFEAKAKELYGDVSTPQRFDWNLTIFRWETGKRFQPRNGSIGIF